MASNVLNFTRLRSDGSSFSFGESSSSDYFNFNFTEGGYTPSYDFNFGEVYDVYNIIKSLSDDFVAIWADSDASLENGKMYVSSAASFNIISLSTNSVEDYYTESHAGEAGEVLEGDDIVDVNAL